MSGIFKKIGKVFKKVFKVVKKVLPIALAVGAIVLTGGAAIGALPAVGTVIGGLGLSAGVTTALTSAVTMAGWGGLAGLVTGGVKGMTRGALMGGLLGGVAGAAGIMGGAAGGAGAGLTDVPIGVLSQGSLVPGAAEAAGAVASGAGGAVAAAPAAASGMSGLLGNLGGSQFLSQALMGLGGGMGQASDIKAAKEARRERQKQLEKNYDTSGGPLDTGGLLGYQQGAPAPMLDPYSNTTNWAYDPELGRLVRKGSTSVATMGG